MTAVPIAEIVNSRLVDPRRHLDADRVRRYTGLLDTLPPVTVFRLPDQTLLLVDGYHRVAAAQEVGRSTIEADLREGTKADALEFAIRLAARERGATSEEARSAIQRYRAS